MRRLQPIKSMLFLVSVCLQVGAMFGCSSKDSVDEKPATTSETQPNEGSAKDDGVIKQPDNVAGGFGLYMECSLVTRQDSEVKTASVGCVLKENNGEKYIGKIDRVTATVFVAGAAQGSSGTVLPADADTPYDFFVETASSGSIVSIKAEFTADGQLVVLDAPVYAVQQKSSANMTLYVSKQGNGSVLCRLDAPCKTITEALAKIPERLDHSIEIIVRETTEADAYAEFLTVRDFTFGANGKLLIRGAAADMKNPGRFFVNSKGLGKPALALQSLPGVVEIRGATLIGSESNGVNAAGSSALYLTDVEVKDSLFGIYATMSAIWLNGTFVARQNTKSGVVLGESSHIYSSGSVSITVIDNGESGFIVRNSTVTLQKAKPEDSCSLAVESVTADALQILAGGLLKVSGCTSASMKATKASYFALRLAQRSSFVVHGTDAEQMEMILEKFGHGQVISATEDSRIRISAPKLKLSIISINAATLPPIGLDSGASLEVMRPIAACQVCVGNAFVGFQSGIFLFSPARTAFYESDPSPALTAIFPVAP